MGRILDRFGFSLDRPILTKGLDLGQLIPASMFKNIRLIIQHWPGDIQIRRNMVNSAWLDIPSLICDNQAQVFNSTGNKASAAEFTERSSQ
jgi:methionine synthase II (cobalamin-independent)